MKLVKKVWGKWLAIAKTIGNFQAQVIFSLFYLLALCVIGVIFRFFTDPINIKTKKSFKKVSNFNVWQHQNNDIIDARKQF